MNLKANGIDVDAGLIMISDLDYYDGKGKYVKGMNYKETLGKVLAVEPGEYRVNWKIEDTWNGPISGTDCVTITSGLMMVSDPCYHIDNDEVWSRFCDSMYPNGCIVIDSMGGDGTYDVELELECISK